MFKNAHIASIVFISAGHGSCQQVAALAEDVMREAQRAPTWLRARLELMVGEAGSAVGETIPAPFSEGELIARLSQPEGVAQFVTALRAELSARCEQEGIDAGDFDFEVQPL